MIKKNKYLIPVNEPLIKKKDAQAVFKTVRSSWISSSGMELDKFEKKFAKIIGKKYAISVSNGTAALEIALKSIGIKKNDEVIIPNFTIISNALAVIKLEAQPILVDCDIYNWNMNIEEVKKKITKKTKAIIATHIYNYPLEIDKLKEICKIKKIKIIEDAAEVIGLKYKNKMCGSFGDISTFSFYANKHITTGEGGMILTNDFKIYKKCKSLKNLCFGNGLDRFKNTDIGWNYRLTNIQASLGLSQLNRLKDIVRKKVIVGKTYYKYLKNNKNIYFPKPKRNNLTNIYWVNGFLILKNCKKDAKKLSDELLSYNIETRPFFWPMHKQQILKKFFVLQDLKSYQNSEFISKFGIYLPSSINLNKNKIKYISSVVNLLTYSN
jgi:perosamine synthetase